MARQCAVLFFAVVAAGCSGLTDSTGQTPFKDIGPAGGVLHGAQVDVVVPPQALAGTTRITVAEATDGPAGHVGPAFALGPEGTQFAVPATVTIHFDPALPTPAGLRLSTVVAGAWVQLAENSVDATAHVVSGQTPHFSTFGLTQCSATTCAAQSKDCGTIDDGCGGTLDCGTCAAGIACGATTPNVCATVTCNAITCPGGCCAGWLCSVGPSLSTCGLAGSACVACNTTAADNCSAGSCKCGTGTACAAGQRCTSGTCI